MTSCIDLAFGFTVKHYRTQSVIVEEDTDTGEETVVLVLEDQYIGKNWATGKVLITRRVRWQAIAELFGWEVIMVNPSTWQSRVLARLPGADTKSRSVFLAEDITGTKPPTDDVADAICIGEFWIRQARLPAQTDLFEEAKPKQKRPTQRRKRR